LTIATEIIHRGAARGWKAFDLNNPELAWSITLDLIDRSEDELETAGVAAGPLEDLIREHPDAIWADLGEKASTNAKLATALRGVWVFESDGDVYGRFMEMMETLNVQPN
jgi:hypothetical protein